MLSLLKSYNSNKLRNLSSMEFSFINIFYSVRCAKNICHLSFKVLSKLSQQEDCGAKLLFEETCFLFLQDKREEVQIKLIKRLN